MQEYIDDRNYDCIVVGGGASGLAAISAMADLGISNTILLEKNNELGGRLLEDENLISLSGKSFSGKELLAQFSRLMEIYEVKTALNRELISVTTRYRTLRERYSLRINETEIGNKEFADSVSITIKNNVNQSEELYRCNYLILAFSGSEIFPLANSDYSEDRVKFISTESLRDSLELGGKIGRDLGELLLRKKKEEV